MTRQRLRVGIAVGFLAIAAAFALQQAMRRPDLTLRVLIPVQFLISNNKLNVKPENLSSTFQYYLLENLAVGLVRDSASDPRGYVGGLAETWRRNGPKNWIFKLRNDLRWSDGSHIEGQEIALHLKSLSGRGSRHLQRMKHLVDAVYNGQVQEIEVSFDTEMGVEILSELSLADASLVSAANVDGDWTITSGAYSLPRASLAPEGPIDMVANAHSSMISPASPTKIQLWWPTNLDDLTTAFEHGKVDLFVTITHIFTRRQQAMIKQAPHQFRGHPNLLYYLAFNDFLGQQDTPLRRQIAEAFDQALQGFVSPAGLNRELQFVPEGFAGRLGNDRPKSQHSGGPSSLLSGRVLSIRLAPQMKELVGFDAVLSQVEKRLGCQIKVEYKSMSEHSAADKFQLSLWTFKGNQADPLGSWSFLFSSDKGQALAGFSQFAKPYLDAARIQTGADFQATMSQLHRKAIDDAWGIPLFNEIAIALGSDRVDLSSFNPIDMRQRYYSLSIK